MRRVFMAYVTDTVEAVAFFCRAFGGTAKNCFKRADDEDFYAHAEIDVKGEIILALSEAVCCDMAVAPGSNMDFWMTFDDEQALRTAYDVLRENADVHSPLAPCDWCPAMAALTDKFGLRWLLSVKG